MGPWLIDETILTWKSCSSDDVTLYQIMEDNVMALTLVVLPLCGIFENFLLAQCSTRAPPNAKGSYCTRCIRETSGLKIEKDTTT
jgi:hypothetical protein